jgi:hypothetical protein
MQEKIKNILGISLNYWFSRLYGDKQNLLLRESEVGSRKSEVGSRKSEKKHPKIVYLDTFYHRMSGEPCSSAWSFSCSDFFAISCNLC